jgi:hypothetical protein
LFTVLEYLFYSKECIGTFRKKIPESDPKVYCISILAGRERSLPSIPDTGKQKNESDNFSPNFF